MYSVQTILVIEIIQGWGGGGGGSKIVLFTTHSGAGSSFGRLCFGSYSGYYKIEDELLYHLYEINQHLTIFNIFKFFSQNFVETLQNLCTEENILLSKNEFIQLLNLRKKYIYLYFIFNFLHTRIGDVKKNKKTKKHFDEGTLLIIIMVKVI